MHISLVLQSTEAATRGALQKKGALKTLLTFTGKNLCQSFLIKLQASAGNIIKKETLKQVL